MAKRNNNKKIEETLKDFKVLMVRYREVLDDEELLNLFLSRNRNPIFDITRNSMFKTGLMSEEAKKLKLKADEGTDDHFIQRTKAMKYIFDYILTHPDIDYNEFVVLLKKYASTVKITKEEHNQLTAYALGKVKFNFELYEECGIIVEGLSDYIPAELL